jgi:hypothetical protein
MPLDFNQKLLSIDKDNLVKFLNSLIEPCYESELLKVSFPGINVFNSDSLKLYQSHFVLFHLLYKLQDEFYAEGKYLHIHFMRTFLISYPEIGLCRYYDEQSGKFCKAECLLDKLYCKFHFGKYENEIETLSIKYFYLDIDNYNNLNDKTADDFINGSWEILLNYKEFQRSFEILELPQSSSLDMIKKQFKILAKKFHPDHGETSHNKFNEINRAYRFLLKVMPYFGK